MNNLKYIVVSTFVFLLLGMSANAQPIEMYAIGQERVLRGGGDDTLTTSQEGPSSILYSIDPSTGAPSTIGVIGFELCLGLDLEPGTNRAFAVCNRIQKDDIGEGPIDDLELENRMEDVGQVLIMLDLATGQGTEIGPLGIALTDAAVSDVSFRSDGVLFGIVGFATEPDNQNGDALSPAMLDLKEVTLVRIDTTTGKAVEVGPTGTGFSIDSIGFSDTDSLYHATDNILDEGALNMLDHFTGQGTNIDDLDYPPGFDEDGVFNFVTSMDHASSTNELFAMFLVQDRRDNGGGVEEVAPESRVEVASGSFLGRINPLDGAIELIGMTSDFDNNFIAITVLNRDAPRNVPTLSEYGLIATSIFLLLAAVIYLRRRQLKTQM